MYASVSERSYGTFFLLLVGFLVLRGVKEVLKLLVFFRAWKLGSVPLHGNKFIESFWLSPFLVCIWSKDQFTKDILEHESSLHEWMLAFLVDGMFHSLPQLVLSLYYFVFVVQTGLGTTAILSTVGTCISAAHLLVRRC